MQSSVRRAAISCLSGASGPPLGGAAPGLRTYTTAHDEVYDVAIVGGGMIGACMAAKLLTQPLTRQLNIALLDRGPKPAELDAMKLGPSDCPDLRVSTITPSSMKVLEACGAWDLVERFAAPFHTMQVWDAGSRGFLRWDASACGMEHMGHVLENRVIQAGLFASCDSSLKAYFDSRIEEIKLPLSSAGRHGGGFGDTLASIRLASGESLRARLVVGADGASSVVRNAAGISATEHNYGQRGVVATVAAEGAQGVAWQRFLPTGPIALLPVRNGLWNVVWTTTPDMARFLEDLPGNELVDALNKAMHWEANAGSPPSPLASMVLRRPMDMFATPPTVLSSEGGAAKSFPLRQSHATAYTLARTALIGDAAHTVHPLAGQGANMGFGDVNILAQAIEEALRSGDDIGDPDVLRSRYGIEAWQKNALMMAALDFLWTAFDTQGMQFDLLRGLGMDMLNASVPLKTQVMKFAMGMEVPGQDYVQAFLQSVQMQQRS